MLNELVQDKIYYKIFDRSFKQSTYIYGKYKTSDAIKLTEIEKNLQAIRGEFSSSDILILDQVHGNVVIDADELDDFHSNPVADAAVTTKKGLILAVLTADCVPVLLTSTDGKIIGVAHCGWKSAKGDIVDKLIKKMKDKGASDLKALIGPSIQQHSYEVDHKYYQDFMDHSRNNDKFFIPSKNSGHHMFDLAGFVKLKLSEAGVEQIETYNEDTYSQPHKYPSCRRSYHQGKKFSEQILSTLVIK